jgi:hypothetical protein
MAAPQTVRVRQLAKAAGADLSSGAAEARIDAATRTRAVGCSIPDAPQVVFDRRLSDALNRAGALVRGRAVSGTRPWRRPLKGTALEPRRLPPVCGSEQALLARGTRGQLRTRPSSVCFAPSFCALHLGVPERHSAGTTCRDSPAVVVMIARGVPLLKSVSAGSCPLVVLAVRRSVKGLHPRRVAGRSPIRLPARQHPAEPLDRLGITSYMTKYCRFDGP